MGIAAVEYLKSGDCLLAIRRRVNELSEGVDPAPWYVAGAAAQPGDNETPHIRQMAIYHRANLTFFRAMLLGSLSGWFVDGNERWRIPGWAWADQGGDWQALLHGNDFLHPLAPPEIRRWAWREVLVEQSAFELWLRSDHLLDQSGFPDLPTAHDEIDRPEYVSHLPPPDTPNVSLTHAVSWLAFGISMDARTFWEALGGGVLGSDQTDASRRTEAAVESLVTAGTGGLPFLGKFVPVRTGQHAALTERVPLERLEDFRQYDLGADTLRYGTGIRHYVDHPGFMPTAQRSPVATHKYIDVKVERRGLLTLASSLLLPTRVDDAPIRKKRGPAPDENWEWAIQQVTDACIDAGYSKPLKRGNRSAIETQLLDKMSERGRNMSEDSARRYAERVIANLPD